MCEEHCTTVSQVVQEQRQALEKQLVELAITGAAFAKLQQSEAMEQLLFYTRLFARFAPEQKVNRERVCVCVLCQLLEPCMPKQLQHSRQACSWWSVLTVTVSGTI